MPAIPPANAFGTTFRMIDFLLCDKAKIIQEFFRLVFELQFLYYFLLLRHFKARIMFCKTKAFAEIFGIFCGGCIK